MRGLALPERLPATAACRTAAAPGGPKLQEGGEEFIRTLQPCASTPLLGLRNTEEYECLC